MSGFYDDLAPSYHLLFEDWDASIERQGRTLSEVIRSEWPGHNTVLDVSCGIGTQAIALSNNGFRVTGSDVSANAIDRAREEARKRNCDIAFSVCDMREAKGHHGSGFDLVVSCDNSVPHLLTDADILDALEQMYSCLRPGGGCLLTVRDYDLEPRGKNIVKQVRTCARAGSRYSVFQIWDFDADQYDLTMTIVDENLATGNISTQVLRSRYYAIGVERLLGLVAQAGFPDPRRIDNVFYQPVIVGTKPL